MAHDTEASTRISSVVLVGAGGKLGDAILRALIQHNFAVTVLKRQSSRSALSHPHQATVSDGFEVAELVPVLQGKDAVVVAIGGSEVELQKRLADACVRAGVKRFIPADFGSCDSGSALAQNLVPLYKRKTELRTHLQELATAASTGSPAHFSWTALVCGHFFDWSADFLHLDVGARRAEMLDDGSARWSASTLGRAGEATARVLQRGPADAITRNRVVFVQSFCVSQSEVIAAFERATGGAPWKVTQHESATYVATEKPNADAGDHVAVDNLVWYLGTFHSDWTKRGEDFVMSQLGMEDEDLDAVVTRIVREG